MFTHTITGNMIYEKLNPDLYAPVGTDGGDVSDLKWPLGLSFNRPGLHQAGFARQQNIIELPVAVAFRSWISSIHGWKEYPWMAESMGGMQHSYRNGWRRHATLATYLS